MSVQPFPRPIDGSDMQPATSPESRVLRALQQAIDAFAADEPPTPRVREDLRQQMRAAVDTYFSDKLEEARRKRSKPG